MIAEKNTSTNEASADPIVTSREQLEDTRIYEQFAEETERIVREDDREEAIEGRYVLEEILLGKYPQLETEAPELTSKYKRLIALMKFVSLSVRSLLEVEELIRKYLTIAVKSEINLRTKFQDVLTVYHDITMGGRVAESLAKAFLSNSEVLVNDQIRLRGKENPVQATVGNFVQDYMHETKAPVGQYKRAGSLERITYVNQNRNAKSLSKEDKNILLKVLELYDWIRFGSAGLMIEEGIKSQRVVKVPRKAPQPSPKAPPFAKVLEDSVVKKRMIPRAPRPLRKPPSFAEVTRGQMEGKASLIRPINPTHEARLSREQRPEPVEKKQQSPQPAPKQANMEEVYASTLDDLNKIRNQYEKPKRGQAKRGPVSLNEAIIREGTDKSQFRGEIVAGEKEIQEKLNKLEDKVDRGKSNLKP